MLAGDSQADIKYESPGSHARKRLQLLRQHSPGSSHRCNECGKVEITNGKICIDTVYRPREQDLVQIGKYEFSDIENKLPAIVGPLPFHTLEAIHYLGEEQ